jgi:creatinine amidohydrolase
MRVTVGAPSELRRLGEAAWLFTLGRFARPLERTSGAMRGRYLAELTWVEAEEFLARGWPLLLPIGAGCKEHGHHLPLGNDQLLADGLTRRVLDRVEALALPTLNYGYYPAFLEYPGSVSLPAQVMSDTVVAICHSLHQQGGRRFYALNTGVSTVRPLTVARQQLRDMGIDFDFCELGQAIGAVEARLKEQTGGTHADEMETSMMLELCPEIVHMEKARPDYHGELHGGLTRRPDGPGVYSPTGAWGDPTLATVAKGRELVGAWVDYVVSACSS